MLDVLLSSHSGGPAKPNSVLIRVLMGGLGRWVRMGNSHLCRLINRLKLLVRWMVGPRHHIAFEKE
jgi:hypothetical protein